MLGSLGGVVLVSILVVRRLDWTIGITIAYLIVSIWAHFGFPVV